MNRAREELLGLGQSVRLVAFERQQIISSVDQTQLSRVGFCDMGRIRRHAQRPQVHLWQMQGHGGFLVGVSRHGNLIDQSLSVAHEIDQRQRLVRFGLLLVGGDFDFHWGGLFKAPTPDRLC